MTAVLASLLALALLATGGIAAALPLVLPVLTGAALTILGWVLAGTDPLTAESCHLAGIATAAAVVPIAQGQARARIAAAISLIAMPLAAVALATSPSALWLGLAAVPAAGLLGPRAASWQSLAALGVAAIAGGVELEYPGLAAATLIGSGGGIAAWIGGRHAPAIRHACFIPALACLLPVAAALALRGPWLLAPLLIGLLPLAGVMLSNQRGAAP